MTGGKNPGKAFDAVVEDILPSDIDETTISDHSNGGDGEGWFKSNYTYTQQTTPEYRNEVGEAEIRRLAETLDLPESVTVIAVQTFQQYAERSDHPFVVELYAAAALYCAAKLNGEAITSHEIATAGPELLTRKVLLRRSKPIASELGFQPSVFNDPAQYIDPTVMSWNWTRRSGTTPTRSWRSIRKQVEGHLTGRVPQDGRLQRCI